MNYIKKFEAWAGQPLPVIPTHLLMKYFKCNKCDELNIGQSVGKCKCGSTDVTEITEGDYDKEVRKRVPKQFWHVLDKRKEEFEDDFVPLNYLNKRKDN